MPFHRLNCALFLPLFLSANRSPLCKAPKHSRLPANHVPDHQSSDLRRTHPNLLRPWKLELSFVPSERGSPSLAHAISTPEPCVARASGRSARALKRSVAGRQWSIPRI